MVEAYEGQYLEDNNHVLNAGILKYGSFHRYLQTLQVLVWIYHGVRGIHFNITIINFTMIQFSYNI